MAKLTARQQLDNLTDAMVEDILSLSDEEVMQEMLEDLGSQEAVDAEIARIREIFERARKQARVPL